MLSKLLSMPYKYFMGNRVEREVLFPTLICLVYQNDHNYAILLKEMSSELLIEYIESNIESWSSSMSMNITDINSYSEYMDMKPARHQRSQSISSAHSSVNSVRLQPSAIYNFSLHYRFSAELWKSAIDYFKTFG